ncbi:MAG TPA: HlyC/CorC family transporter, partial [bacterium]|nr:HlyC/CorC family transporter [bacterium]
MESDSFFKFVSFIFLIFLSSFFSGSEAAYFSLSREMIDRLAETATKNAQRVVKLLRRPRHLLVTILVGNTVVNVSAASIAALLTADISDQLNFSREIALMIEVVVVTLLLLIFSELMPKIVAIKNPYKFSATVSIPLRIVSFILYPIVIILDKFPALFSGLMATRVKKHLLSKEELKTLIEFSEERGALEEEERDMIHSIFDFSQTLVKEIMVPRIDMVCVEKNTSLEGLVNIIHSNGHTRIPLYDEKVDNILGIIHAKELLPFISNQEKKVDLIKLARDAMFVPDSKRIDELLNELQTEKQHMAIVVDEYGGTAGLITLEDIIEEIVGEIQDEYDKEKPLYKKIGENQYLIDAKIDLDELNEELKLDFPLDKGYE